MPSLELKTRSEQLLGSLLLDIELPVIGKYQALPSVFRLDWKSYNVLVQYVWANQVLTRVEQFTEKSPNLTNKYQPRLKVQTL